MVKKILPAALIIFFISLICSCFLAFSGFVYSSDIDERREERNNLKFLNTLPQLSTEGGEYSFIVLTDTHLDNNKTNGLEKLPQLVAQDSKIKFAIILGDITDKGQKKDFETYCKIADELKQLGVPFYPVIGNHDLTGDGWKFWKENIGSTNYRIDEANTTFIILDSANIYYGKDQLDWLEKELINTNRDVFVFSHVPLFGQGYLLQIEANERARITSILRNKCDIMFTGHIHSRYTHKTGNVEYVTIENFNDTKNYCYVTVTDTGYSYEFKKLD